MHGDTRGYTAPIDDIVRALRVAGLNELLQVPAYAGIDEATVREALDGFGRLAAEVITPSDVVGDRVGATLDRSTHTVAVPAELVTAFDAYMAGGWGGIAAPAEYGGGGLPKVLATAVHEIFGSANLALSINPMLTQSAIELLERWGDERQQRDVLPRLVSGEWTGTMNLTEPDAGSDLGAIRTTAEPTGDGRWIVNGTKIYITWGEHELRPNIVHLVLARTPGAPEGTKGISLFMVPKFQFTDRHGDTELANVRNGVRCLSLEHKLGIHASPTCVLSFEDAVGELVGPLHGGMAAMFSMMNPARLAVGVQGVSIGERAMQQAIAYAAERRQGSDPDHPGGSVSIDVHPDVRRTLADLATTVDALRMLAFTTAIEGDLADRHVDAERRERARRRADLLTPLVKSFGTDQGVRLASIALQVHGGMGFIEETGIAQRYRDARIAPIYEGTNGIQAIDLLLRKIVRDRGTALDELLDEIDGTVSNLRATGVSSGGGSVVGSSPTERGDDPLADVCRELSAATTEVRALASWAIEHHGDRRRAVLTGATAFQELLSLVACTHMLLKAATAPGAGDREIARAQCFTSTLLARRPRISDIQLGDDTVDTALS